METVSWEGLVSQEWLQSHIGQKLPFLDLVVMVVIMLIIMWMIVMWC